MSRLQPIAVLAAGAVAIIGLIVALPDGVHGWPVAAIDDSSFLIFDRGEFSNSPTRLYKVTIGAKELTAMSLLPDSNKTIGDVVVSPDRTQAAFTLQDSGGGVYVTSLLHESEPRQISATSGALLEWLP